MVRTCLGTIAALLAAAPVVAQVAQPPVPLENPALWVDPTDYPPEALRGNMAGRVKVSLAVDATGRISGCRVEESSGSASLDMITCRLLRQRGRFRPAYDADGRAVPDQFALPVRWAMPATSPFVVDLSKGPRQTQGEVEITVDPSGNVRTCRVIGAPPRTPVDLCAANPAGSASRYRFVRDGRPVAGVVRTRVSITQEAATP